MSDIDSDKNTLKGLPSYGDVEAAVGALGMVQTASEFHGLLCGFLCAGSKMDNDVFLKALVKNADGARKEIDTLSQLYKATQQQINSLSFEFYLLLPDDEVFLESRAYALSQWCRGFNAGILDAGVIVETLDAEELRDAFVHIAEISELDYDYVEVSEEDERAFFDVAEYVRMAILMIHTELTQAKPATTNASDTLH